MSQAFIKTSEEIGAACLKTYDDEEVYSDSESEDEEGSQDVTPAHRVSGRLSHMHILTKNIQQLKPERRPHLMTDIHHLEEDFECKDEDSEEDDSEGEESDEEYEQLEEILNSSRSAKSTLGLMHMMMKNTLDISLQNISKKSGESSWKLFELP